jgi:hypothetical protein
MIRRFVERHRVCQITYVQRKELIMRTRLIPYAGWFALALGGIGGTSCSNLDLGQEKDAQGPLNVNHVVFIDVRRGTNPDLLNDDAEKRAAGRTSQGRACSFVEPCPPPVVCGELLFQGASTGIFAPFPATPGICHDPENVQEVAPSVDSAIRICFNKLLDNRIVNVAGQVVPTSITIQDSTGNTVAASEIYYDRSGSPLFTSDPNALPYGPALVFTPSDQLEPGETYTIRINPADVVARNNQLPPTAEDLTLTFTTEGLFPLQDVHCPAASAGAPCELSGLNGAELYVTFNADVDISQATIVVSDSTGGVVTTSTVADDPSSGRPRRLSIRRQDGQAWSAGTYTVAITNAQSGRASYTGTVSVQ